MAAADLLIQADVPRTDWNRADFSSLRLPPGDDMGIPSDDEDLCQDIAMELKKGFESIIVVDNLPRVSLEKFQKLLNVVKRRFGLIGRVDVDNGGIWMPVDPETGWTLGYCFIEYATPEEAEYAREETNGYPLDKSHIFAVNMFDDIEKFMKVPAEWTPPETKPYTPGEHLQIWLTDAKARDQFVIRSGSDTEIFWNNAWQLKPEPVFKRSNWTESYVQWSPLGTDLATIHRQGVAVWGGDRTFNKLRGYIHPMVKLVAFSPGERFLVTYSCHEPSNPPDRYRVVVNIFDVKTGKVMRAFRGSADDFAVGGSEGVAGVSWPVFRWAGGREDKYFARMGKNLVSVYETETFSLINKKSIKIENVMDFSWSPVDSMLALFVPEIGNQPARVSLVQIPSKEELRQKNLFSVSGCEMFWQSNGEYLAVKVDRYTKTRKHTLPYARFELFRIKERDIPIEDLELENKNDKIIVFAWEPKGHRFAVIHGDHPRPDVSFYSMRTAHCTGRVSKLATVKSKQANSLYWSPSGHHIILAGLKGLNGKLEFYNVDALETMATAEHFMATDLEWDPTGRYVATSVTSVHEMENGFNIWSFHGKLLYRILKDHFFQYSWRPRPPSLLHPEKEEEIAKNLKKYSKKYEAEDQDVSNILSKQERQKRNTHNVEWQKWLSEWKRLHEEEKSSQLELWGGGEPSNEEDGYEDKVVEAEEVLHVEEVILDYDEI